MPSDPPRDDLVALLARLEIEGDEGAVASLVVVREPSDPTGWLLLYGSLVVGPREMSTVSWAAWRDADDGETSPFTSLLGMFGDSLDDWTTFDHTVGEWRMLRFPVDLDDLTGWLDDVLEGQVRTPAGQVGARPRQADSLITTFTHGDGPASLLAAMTFRPTISWVQPLYDGPDTVDSRRPPDTWELGSGNAPPGATLQLVGVAGGGWAPLKPGLLVARTRHLAWIADMRGGRPDYETFEVRIRYDPTRVGLDDLTLQLEETNSGGEMVAARHLRLGDLRVPDRPAPDVTVLMPSLGPGLTRRVRLHHVDGTLLDGADDVHLAETVHLGIAVDGQPPAFTVVGGPIPPTVLRRLAATDRAEREYAAMLEDGLAGRIVVQRTAGVQAVQDRLAAARGELLIADPFFGADDAGWTLLTGVAVPVRVLVGKKLPSPTRADSTPSLRVRRWEGSPPVPFHDRFFLWDGGGLTVGTSPNGLGNRLTLVEPLATHVAAALRVQFETWWADPSFRDVRVI